MLKTVAWQRIRGVVLDPDGEPCPGIAISPRARQDGEAPPLVQLLREKTAIVRSGPDGRFEWLGAAWPKCWTELSASGFWRGKHVTPAKPVRVEQEDLEGLRLQLQLR